MNSKKKQIDRLYSRVINLEHNIQVNELRIETLDKAYNRLFSILIESGIIETNWLPSAPKGSTITPNGQYGERTYTKINKVF